MTRTEDYLRKGKLVALLEERDACKKKLERLLEELRVKSFPLEGVEAVDVEAIQQAAEEASAEQHRLVELTRQIAELKD